MERNSTQQKLMDNIMSKVEEFPTLPTIYTKLSETIANPRCSAQDVADVISQDQSSVTKILKIANSAMYGLVRKVSSISQAVVYIGFEEIKSIVLAISVMKMFEGAKDSESLKPIDIWKFSFGVGAISRNIAKGMNEKLIEDYFVAGIVHGIGKLLFLSTIPDIYDKVVKASKQKGEYLHTIERQVFGITHMRVGEMLMEKWRLPKPLCLCLGNYQSGMVDGRFHSLSSVTHIAFISALMLNFGDSGYVKIPPINKDLWENIKIPKDFYSSNYHQIFREYSDMSNLLLKN